MSEKTAGLPLEAATPPPEIHDAPEVMKPAPKAPEPMSLFAPPPEPPAAKPVEAKPVEANPAPDPKVAPSDDIKALRQEIEAQRARIDQYESGHAKHTEQLDQQRESMKAALMDKLGVRSNYRGFCPDADPFTEDGRAAIETFFSDRAELCDIKPAGAPDQPLTIQTAIKDKPGAWLVRPEAVRESFDLLNDALKGRR